MSFNEKVLSCKKVAEVFEAMTDKEYDLIDFIRKILISDYKYGIEQYYPIYFTQDVEYYYECFNDWFELKKSEVIYNKEVLYWIGYIFQSWYIDFNIDGIALEKMLTNEIILKLYEFWDIYHTQDSKYVYEDIFLSN
ncbi:MAG: hypothetical protein ACRDD7_08740 [Peptostreptococcaceae bacterium]